ncbi:MAG: 1-acyl-sn-glycerol-3-phosphate acyltransferase [Lachnospiraceae bacterium]|nr:1-acyl-sn-glycerol-3-phosphate acyltransferase [Lachnospiraceae bacterium]
MKNRVIYYSDELNDDFAGNDIKTSVVDGSFVFEHKNIFWRIAEFVIYYIIVVPLIWLFMKVYHGFKIKNRRIIRTHSKRGYLLYANHTQTFDSFLPAIASFPKKGFVIANPDAVSIPLIRNLVLMLGCIPIPTAHSGMRGFLDRVYGIIERKGSITIFPEAHIWPYYTKIRPFIDVSFRYPVKADVPVIPMVTTYRKRRGLFALCKRPAMTVTVCEPIFPNTTLPQREAIKKLRDETYEAMKKVSETNENIEYVKYIKTPPDQSPE